MRFFIGLPLLALLASCGGDDTPSTPTNTAPTFTSATAVSIVENLTNVQDVRASDAQNDPITLSISGGADAAQFALDITGRLSFRAAPNFDLPGDANGDNVYEITLSATDGKASTSQDVRVTVTNDREGIAVKRVATGFTQPMQVYKDETNANLLYVAERAGRLYSLDTRTGVRTLVATVPSVSTDGERGLLGFVVGRDGLGGTSNRPAFYILATGPDGAINLHWYVKDAFGVVAPQPDQPILLSIPHPDFNNNNGGWIDFGPPSGGDAPTASLYVGIGDGGGVGDPNNNAQNPNSRLGKILRLSRSTDPYAGATPVYWTYAPTNPFANGGGDPYVFAMGLRNPFRGTVDGNGMIFADVGQDGFEEINASSPNAPGPNFGWPYMEGTHSYRGVAPAGLARPALQYSHGNGPFRGSSIIGGKIYHGPINSLFEHYVFADFVSKNIWSVPTIRFGGGSVLDGAGYQRRNEDFAPDVGTIDQPVSFGTDSAGNLYIVDLDGEIFKIVMAGT